VASVAQPSLPAMEQRIFLYGGDSSSDAPLAAWYREIGLTDVWVYPVRGAFPQDQDPRSQRTVEDLNNTGVLPAYRAHQLGIWWFERPVPDILYVQFAIGFPSQKDSIWGNTREADETWANIASKIRSAYGEVRKAGFQGIVYDTEAYYSYDRDHRVWLWQGHDNQLGTKGEYYKRGLEIGRAIHDVWPNAPVVIVYAFGYDGEYWWYKGIQDGGTDLYLGIEHTYGAGPVHQGDQWYQHWWQGRDLVQTVSQKMKIFDFLPDHNHIIAGLFPIDFGSKSPNYEFRYFKQQLDQAKEAYKNQSLSVWIWPQGPFSPGAWSEVKLPSGENPQEYWNALIEFSHTRAR